MHWNSLVRSLYGIYAIAAFAVVVLIMFCPLLIAAPWLTARRMIGRAAVRAWLASIGVRFAVSGLENLPDGPCVVVCNHASYVDGIALTAALPTRFTFLVQQRIAGWPYVGLIIRRMGSFFVNRDQPRAAAAATRRLIRDLRAGGSLAIFPEGTFRREPGLMPFYPGAFFVAARTGVPVVTTVMRGTRQFFHDGARFPSWSRIDIEVLGARYAPGARRVHAEALMADCFRQMDRACGELPAPDVAFDDRSSAVSSS